MHAAARRAGRTTAPKNTPAQGPHWYPANPAPKVPSTIIPSMPMLTTPARSDHSPESPASAIGVAATIAASMAPEESRLLAPVSTRTAETTESPISTMP